MSRRNRILAALMGATMVVGIGACSSDEETSSTDTSPPPAVSPAVVSTRHLSPQAFAAAVAQPGTVVLDVRTPEEYATGHITQAKNVDVQASDFAQKLASFDKAASYAIYCRSGKRSAAAAQQMQAAGFTKVVDLDGGIIAWTAAGNQVTTH